MTNPFHAFVADQLGERLKQRRIVVWYDPRSEFVPFVNHLAETADGSEVVTIDVGGESVSLVVHDGSLYSTRLRVEPLAGLDDPAPLVVYLPDVKRSLDGSVLMELESAGTHWEPQLKQLARNALRQRFTDGVIDELLGRDSITFGDIAQAFESTDAAPPSILKTLLPVGTSETQLAAWLADDALDTEIEAKEANDELRKLVMSRLGVELDGNDLSKWRRIVARTALGTEFRSDLAGTPPPQLDSLPTALVDHERNARTLCTALRSTHAAAYPALADQAATELQLDASSIDALELGSIDTFRFEETALLHRCGELVRDSEYQRVIDITKQRSDSFWLSESLERQAQWEAIRLAAELGAAADEVDTGLAKPPRTVEEWVDRYATGWHLLDRAQRHFEAWLPKLEDDPDEQAVAALRHRYETALKKLATGYSAALQGAGWDTSSVLQQTSIFDTIVKPTNGRVAYFLVDAMRYEMGAELAERLEAHGEVSIKPAIGVLPSITTTGMAALMPGASQAYDVVETGGRLVARVDGTLLGDLKARKKHLAARVPASADFELGELLSLTKKAVAKKIDKADLVVVRSQDIDLFGESGASFHARGVMNTVIDHLVQAVKKLAGAGIDRAVIASDHGHLYAAADLDESMRIDAPGGATIELHRRCWIGRGGATPSATVRVAASSLGNDTDLDFLFPTGCGVLRAGGDLAFHHGGISLQETMIPVITVRSDAVVEGAADGSIAINVVDTPEVITNRIFSVKLSFASMNVPPIRPVLISNGRQVGVAGMAVGGELDRSTGTVTIPVGGETTVGFVLDADDIDSLRIIVIDPTSDAELYRSPSEIPVRLGVA